MSNQIHGSKVRDAGSDVYDAQSDGRRYRGIRGERIVERYPCITHVFT